MINNLKYFFLVCILFSSNSFSQSNMKAETMDKAFCEVILVDYVQFSYSKIKEGMTKEQVIAAFKTKYYTRYLMDYFPDYADFVYQIASTVGDENPEEFVNNTLCSKLDSRIPNQ